MEITRGPIAAGFRSAPSRAARPPQVRQFGRAPHSALTIKMEQQILGRLESAAAHRGMSAEFLVTQIVVGVLTRLSIDKALMAYHDFSVDKRAIDDLATRIRKREKRDQQSAECISLEV